MKSYVIQYNAAECSFRNNSGVNTSLTQEHDDDGEKLNRRLFVVCCLLVGLHEVRPLLYTIFIRSCNILLKAFIFYIFCHL